MSPVPLVLEEIITAREREPEESEWAEQHALVSSGLAWLAWEKPGPSKWQFMSFLMPGQKVTDLKLGERLLCPQTAD